MHMFKSLTAGSAVTGTSENKRKSCDSGGLASAILLLLLVSWKTCGTAGWSQDVAGVSAVTSTALLDDDVVDESDASLGLDQFSSAEDIQAKTWRDLLQVENVQLNVTAVMSEIYALLLMSIVAASVRHVDADSDCCDAYTYLHWDSVQRRCSWVLWRRHDESNALQA